MERLAPFIDLVAYSRPAREALSNLLRPFPEPHRARIIDHSSAIGLYTFVSAVNTGHTPAGRTVTLPPSKAHRDYGYQACCFGRRDVRIFEA